MTAAILCPGPSLLRSFAASDYAGLRIGVNRAATALACDWWAACDMPLIRSQWPHVIGTPRLFTIRATRDSLVRRGYPEPNRLTDDLCRYCPEALRWCAFTATSALVLAGHLGATQIDVFGADWTDAPDFDGVMVEGCRRNEQRWADERCVWGDVVSFLAERGVTVERR